MKKLLLLLVIAGATGLGCNTEKATRDACSEGCSDDLLFFDCVDGSVVRDCTNACAVEPLSLADDFATCTDSAGGCGDVSCLSILGIEAEEKESGTDAFQRDRCKDGCNEITSCSSADETSDCLSACNTVPVSDAEAFASCSRITNTCQENRECYTTLGL